MTADRPTDDAPATATVDDPPPLAAVERGGVPRALQLFATGALGGFMTIFGVGVLALPTRHRCCGSSAAQRVADAETKRRCMELGVTPDELAALDAAAGAGGQ